MNEFGSILCVKEPLEMTTIHSSNASPLERDSALFECCHLIWGPWAWLNFSPCVQYFLQGENVCFKNEHPILPRTLRRSFVSSEGPVVLNWHALSSKRESELGLPRVGPEPQSALAYRADNLRGLVHVVVSIPIVGYIRRGTCFHRQTEQYSEREFKREVPISDRSP